MILEGKIITGMGTAKDWVRKIEEVFKQKTNMQVFYGTLNVELKQDYIVTPDLIIEAEEYGGTQKVFVKKCKILKDEAYIVRAEKNQIGKGDYNLKTLELVSNICFRKKYQIKDGENIKIEI